MDRRAIFLAAMLFLAGLPVAASASCPAAERTIYIAAVTGEQSGGLFQLSVQVRPGSGAIYTGIMPRTGLTTQDSEQVAADYAFASTGADRRGCDVLLKLRGDFGESSVDGPSAGAAMAIAMRAALLNRSIRQDMAITGTIDGNGGIGAVGGVVEKSFGAADQGIRYLLVPSLQVYEALLLSRMDGREFAAIEVKNVAEAEKLLFSGASEAFNSTFRPVSEPAPKSLAPIPVDTDLGRFAIVATRMVGDLEAGVNDAFSGGTSTQERRMLAEYFKNETAKYRSLIPLGYPFTAANSAFLLMVDVEYARLGGGQVDLDAAADRIAACVRSLEAPEKTGENLPWAIGADLRRIWAQHKLNQTLSLREEREGYATLRELLYADSWCRVSGELASQAKDIGGTEINESVLAPLASAKLSEAASFLAKQRNPDSDAAWHLANGMDANQSGLFGAAIYEAVYAQAMQQAASEGVNDNTSADARRLLDRKPSSVWGKIYYGQGKYIYADAAEKGRSLWDAKRILAYSSALDSASGEISQAYAQSAGRQPPEEAPAEPAQEPRTGESSLLPTLAIALAALAGMAAIFWRADREKNWERGRHRR